MNPLVSIIIPVYNVEKYLPKCLESVINQTMNEIEIIVVNDESSDDSLKIIHEFSDRDSRIKVVDQKNKGLGGARNSGIKIASGEFLFFLDSDDYIKLETLQETYDYAKNVSADIVVFNYEKAYENGKLDSAPTFGSKVMSRDEALAGIISLKTAPTAWNKLYRRALFQENNILYPEKYLHEDLPVTYKLFWYAKTVGFLDKSYYYWLIRSGSITQRFTFKHINDVLTTFIEMKAFLLGNNVFEKYKKEFARGALQMLTLLLERSVKFSETSSSMSEYIIYNLENNIVLTSELIELIKEYDNKLYEKYQNSLKSTYKYIDSCQNNQSVSLNEAQKKIFKLEEELREVYSARAYKFLKLYYKSRDAFFPPNSKIREIVKKISCSKG